MVLGDWQMDLLSWISKPLRLDALVGIGLLIFLLWWWLPKWQVNRLRLMVYDPKANADVEDNFRKTLGQLFGGIVVLLGAAFAYFQSQQTVAETERARQTSQETASDLLVS